MTFANEVVELLTEVEGKLAVDQLTQDTVRVLVPTYRHIHDSIALAVEQTSTGIVISDGGQLQYLLDKDFTDVVATMECAGAIVLTTHGPSLELEITDLTALGDAILAFADYVATAPMVWHALECNKAVREAPASSTDVMARETRSHLTDRLGVSAEPLIQLKYMVTGREESYPAPLAIAIKGSIRQPELIAGFLDSTAQKQSLTTAKKSTSFLFDVVRDMPDLRKYVIVRGTDRQVEHFTRFYDESNINTISTEDLSLLYVDASSAIEALAPA